MNKKGDNLKDNSLNTQFVERCLTSEIYRKVLHYMEPVTKSGHLKIKCIEQRDTQFHYRGDIQYKTSLFHRKAVKCYTVMSV